jgi:hypothetical protein
VGQGHFPGRVRAGPEKIGLLPGGAVAAELIDWLSRSSRYRLTWRLGIPHLQGIREGLTGSAGQLAISGGLTGFEKVKPSPAARQGPGQSHTWTESFEAVSKVRYPPLAGAFYPTAPAGLSRLLPLLQRGGMAATHFGLLDDLGNLCTISHTWQLATRRQTGRLHVGRRAMRISSRFVPWVYAACRRHIPIQLALDASLRQPSRYSGEAP